MVKTKNFKTINVKELHVFILTLELILSEPLAKSSQYRCDMRCGHTPSMA
jgi:hypothetical protein